MRFSLIICTVNRVEEVDRLLKSLSMQIHTEFDVIIVDQNPDDRLESIIGRYHNLNIQYLKSLPGLSKARNVGIGFARGEIIAFPDDDCWYDPDVLSKVLDLFCLHPEALAMTGQAINTEGNPVANSWDRASGWCNLFNIWNRAISFTLFVRRDYLTMVKGFDEVLGVGSGTPFGSGEETDFLISGLKNNMGIYYTPELKIYHPDPLVQSGQGAWKRALNYGRGLGYVLAKHDYPSWYKLRALMRPLLGMVFSALKCKRENMVFYFYTFLGRLEGLREYTRWRKKPHDPL